MKKPSKRKAKEVECHCCGTKFFTRKSEGKYTRYECYPCQRASFEDWASSVSFPGCTIAPAHITQWKYYEPDLHGGLENEAK